MIVSYFMLHMYGAMKMEHCNEESFVNLVEDDKVSSVSKKGSIGDSKYESDSYVEEDNDMYNRYKCAYKSYMNEDILRMKFECEDDVYKFSYDIREVSCFWYLKR